MKRRPRPSLVSTTMPAFATLFAACSREPPRYARNPPEPTHHDPPLAQDAGASVSLDPVRFDPRHMPPMPLAGAPMPVTPFPQPSSPSAAMPPPSPSPSPSPSSPSAAPAPRPASAAPAMAAAAPADTREPGLYIVHNHPPGTPCRPISDTELRRAIQQAGGT